MAAKKEQAIKLRNVNKKSHGGKKMRKKKTFIKKKKRSEKIVNILKNSVTEQEFLLIRNERIIKLEEEKEDLPKHPCVTCRFFVDGRCERLGRPINQPFTIKCFKHSKYPQQEPIYLAYERDDEDELFNAIIEEIMQDVS